jgi:hypothetical protein
VDEAELPRFCLPGSRIIAVQELELEQSIVVLAMIITGNSSELLIRRHKRGGNIMRKENRLRVVVQELDNIVMADDTTSSSFRKSLSGDDLPPIVGVIVTIAGNLLACDKV